MNTNLDTTHGRQSRLGRAFAGAAFACIVTLGAAVAAPDTAGAAQKQEQTTDGQAMACSNLITSIQNKQKLRIRWSRIAPAPVLADLDSQIADQITAWNIVCGARFGYI